MHMGWLSVGFKGEHIAGAQHGVHGNGPLAGKPSSFVQSLSNSKEIWTMENAVLKNKQRTLITYSSLYFINVKETLSNSKHIWKHNFAIDSLCFKSQKKCKTHLLFSVNSVYSLLRIYALNSLWTVKQVGSPFLLSFYCFLLTGSKQHKVLSFVNPLWL